MLNNNHSLDCLLGGFSFGQPTLSVAVTDNSKPSDIENESVSSDEEEDDLIDFTAEEEKRFER